MSLELIVRLIGLIVFGIIGVFLGEPLGNLILDLWPSSQIPFTVFQVITTLLVGLIGFLIAPWISIKPIKTIHKHLSKVSAQTLVFGSAGLIVGAIIAAILAYPISLLPKPLGSILPFVALLLFGYLGTVIFVARQKELQNIFKTLGKGGHGA